jgi:transformation/transcription domain-associated protein
MENIRSLENPKLTEEQKAKIINELSESFDTLLSSDSQLNINILEVLNIFMNYLKNGEYQFLSESPVQKACIQKLNNFFCLIKLIEQFLQTRKAVLEMLHRLPMSEMIRPHVNIILSLMLQLIQNDNEENVLICLRIIIDLHKQYRPPFYSQVS